MQKLETFAQILSLCVVGPSLSLTPLPTNLSSPKFVPSLLKLQCKMIIFVKPKICHFFAKIAVQNDHILDTKTTC
jgi:hypothetical protein